MPSLNVFETDAFGVIALTDAVNNLNFVPGRIGELGVFEGRGVSTTSIFIEQKNNVLTLLPPTPRGAPGVTVDKPKRNARNLTIPHFEIEDAVYADEIQNIRAFGSESATETVMVKVAERLRDVHLPDHAFTEEHARLGAIKGVITYADGSVLNLFEEFDVTQEPTVNFDLANASPVSGALRAKCQQTIRQMSDLLGGIRFRNIHSLCGDAFFDALVSHPEVVASYTSTPEAAELRRSYVEGGSSYGVFTFGGITFENYRGSVGGVPMVATDSVHLFPVGVPGLFRTIWAPADYNETVNTIGKRLYVKQYPMPNGKGTNLDSQQNALHYCTRPKVLLQGVRSSG